MGAEMREMFNRLVGDGWPVVDEWLGENQVEGLHLEFKRKTNPTTSVVDLEDKTNVAKGLSGFANVEGGVFVIGIDTRKVSGGADVVDSIQAITGVSNFAGRIERDIRTYTDPPIAGLMVQAIEKPGTTDTGIVAIYVPQSDGGPHRVVNTKADANDRYYMRTGASTVTMPHALLADGFGRRPHPKLRLLARLHGGGGNICLLLRLRNDGRGTAVRPAVKLRCGVDKHLRWRSLTSLAQGWTILYEKGLVLSLDEVIYQAGVDALVYPQMVVPVADLEAGTNAGQMIGATLSGTIYMMDARPTEFTGVLRLDEDVELPMTEGS
jgi:hypothetical protein